MNKAFKVLWNQVRGTYVVASEAQVTHGKPGKATRRLWRLRWLGCWRLVDRLLLQPRSQMTHSVVEKINMTPLNLFLATVEKFQLKQRVRQEF